VLVYKGSYNGTEVAVKRCVDETERGKLKQEFKLLNRLTQGKGHPNIVQIIGIVPQKIGKIIMYY